MRVFLLFLFVIIDVTLAQNDFLNEDLWSGYPDASVYDSDSGFVAWGNDPIEEESAQDQDDHSDLFAKIDEDGSDADFFAAADCDPADRELTCSADEPTIPEIPTPDEQTFPPTDTLLGDKDDLAPPSKSFPLCCICDSFFNFNTCQDCLRFIGKQRSFTGTEKGASVLVTERQC
jgi:hypothetical protein